MIDVEEHVYDDDPRKGHLDAKTLLKDVSYFFLGNGRIQAAVQVAPGGEGTPIGLLLQDPERLSKKRDALSFDPDLGLEPTLIRIACRGNVCIPSAQALAAGWSQALGVPAARVKWQAGGIEVIEEFLCPDPESAVLWRTVTLRSQLQRPQEVILETGIAQGTLRRSLVLEPGATCSITLEYALSPDRLSWSCRLMEVPENRASAADYWARTARATFSSPLLDRYFKAACSQLPAAVSASGRVDASIWQYNREWVRDHSWIAVGLVLSGQSRKARILLERLLKEFMTDRGDPIDSSELRHPDEVELDQNGELLYALDQYTRWTGDQGIVRDHWDRVVALAEFPLQDQFRHSPSGLLTNMREYWERHRVHGIAPGMELAHQIFVSLGLESAAGLARLLGRGPQAERWSRESRRLHMAVFEDAGYGFVQQGRILKRRGTDGEICRKIQPLPGALLPDGSPLGAPGDHLIDPDTTAALPLAFGIIPGSSDLAAGTLDGLEALWNQAWKGGGYGRYHSSSEPDAWGPWPFPSLIVARACMEARRFERVWDILRWLDTMPGSLSGTWFEFYGESHSPPFAQIGLTPWTWSEMLMLLVTHVLGIRPGHDTLRIRPILLPGLDRIQGTFPLRRGSLEIMIGRRDAARGIAVKSDAPILHKDAEEVELAYTGGDIHVELDV